MSQSPDSEPQEFLEIFSKRSTVIKPGLERISRALACLRFPARNIPKITVAGTNGKGSTCGYIFRLLESAGLRVGLFSSPHLIEFRERISVSGSDIDNPTLLRGLHAVKGALPPDLWDELTFFEINTILALWVFEEFQTDVNVLEVGLGGRLDCVNVYDADIAVITSIGLDHAEFLGTDLVTIAGEKSGIMRRGRPVFWGSGDLDGADVRLAIKNHAERSGAVFCEPRELLPDESLPKLIKGKPAFLQRNFKLALAATTAWLDRAGSDLSAGELVSGFDSWQGPWPVTLSGRFDFVCVSKGPSRRFVLLDVCHNPHGAKALSAALKESPLKTRDKPLNCLISVLADKDVAGIWRELKDNIREQIAFQIASPRTWSSELPEFSGAFVKNFATAWQMGAFEKGWPEEEPILIFGSVAAVGEVLKYWRDFGWSVERVEFSTCGVLR